MASVENYLLAQIPRQERLNFLSSCTTVELRLTQVLCEPGSLTREVYFPIEGFISLVAMREGMPGLEVGMVGCEGMLGEQLILGVLVAPLHAVVQGQGSAWCMRAECFRKELSRSAALQRVLNRYLYVRMSQLANSASCLRFHLISQRLARWLLMSQDRAHANSFRMTHEFLAYMLGVRRVGITTAAGALQRGGLIEYRHGLLTILDRPGLEAVACSCYAEDEKVYGRQLR